MTESFLAYLWQFQQFDRTALKTAQGEALHVLHPGRPNAHAGADFQDARLRLGELDWAGAVEFHLRSSDWFRHHHQRDAAYESVILHVVWQHDAPIRRPDGTELPVLELAPRTDASLQFRYQALLDSRDVIPCAAQFPNTSALTQRNLLDKNLLQRLERKADEVLDLLDATGGDWEETAYGVLAAAFGFRLNADPMRQLARALPLGTLRKHRGQRLQLEALLFGTAGYLPETPTDEYERELVREAEFLLKKYGLGTRVVGRQAWKFLRLRPNNFPSVRLAQFAALVDQQPNWVSLLLETESVEVLKTRLQVAPSPYWQTHYVFGKVANAPVPALGEPAAESLLLNAAVPLRAAWSRHRDERRYLDAAMALLEALPAERNHVVDLYADLGLSVKTAFDSQALLELHAGYCGPKQCLRCAVGVGIVGRKG
jgi:hypothetical protein